MMHTPPSMPSQRLRAGPYDELYASKPRNILWGNTPSRLITELFYITSRGRVLDIGCGDGVNALALEKAGFDVAGVDISTLALRGLQNRFTYSNQVSRGEYLNDDVRNVVFTGKFDCIVSCGLFHCLPLGERIELHLDIFNLLNNDGIIVFSCLTDLVSMPVNHGTPGLKLVANEEVRRLFDGWKLLHFESGIINDSHYPVITEHQHSVSWVIAKRT